MVKDNRRIAAPDNCISPNVFKQDVKTKIVNKKGIRKDGRKAEDLKQMSLKVGFVPSVSGSAYLECGDTKVICSVIGPRDVLNKSDSATKGQLYCEFKYAMFSCKERQPYMSSDEELVISKSIQDALEPVILLHKFPKSRLDIFICVLENDGGAISSALTCAGAAISNAGVEIYGLPVGCSLIYCDSQFLIDPTGFEESFKEEESFMKINMAMMVDYNSQVIFMDSSGSVNPSLLTKSMKMLQTSCHHIVKDIKLCLKQHVEEMNREAKRLSLEGAVDKKQVTQVKLFQPQTYLRTFFENNIRTDTRELLEFRPVFIDIAAVTKANGSAFVRLGGSTVLCGIKAELTNPLPDKPDKGFFIPNVTLTSICSNRYMPGPPHEQAQVYSQMIYDLWHNFPFLEPEKLCIAPGSLCWCLFADMTCLSDDGNIFDACILALTAALKSTTLPEVLINSDTNKIEVTNNTVDLKMENFIFSASFGIFNDSVIADCCSEEEKMCDSSVTILLNGALETSIYSFGSISDKQVFECIQSAKNRYHEVKEIVESLN